jgi:hypothetical protein
MWDLTVPGNNDHDFYIVAGAPILVHNDCGPVANQKPGELSLDLLEGELSGAQAIRPGSPEWAAATKGSGRYLWAVTENGDLAMVQAAGGIKHVVATGGDPVLGAGQIVFRDGRVTSFDNMTGHYTPTPECSECFLQNGSDAFLLQSGVMIPRSVWTDYGGVAP